MTSLAFLRFSTASALLVLAGCTVYPPSGPHVVGIPGGGKTYEQFTGDDANCRQSAADEVGPVPSTAPVSFGDMQRHYDFAYSQCMIARGNTVQVPPPPPVVVYDAYPFGAPYPMFYGGYNYAPHYYRRY